MKRLAIIFGSVMLVAVITYPVFAGGFGKGRGQGTIGRWEGSPGTCWRYDRGYDTLTQEQRNALSQLEEKFYIETDSLRNEIWAKSDELNILLRTPNPDVEKAKALHQEIIDLRSRMAEKRFDFHLKTRKINPDERFDPGYRRGYGRHMKGYGPQAGLGYGRHVRGYGPGPCWN